MDLGVIRNLHMTIGNMINGAKKNAVPDSATYGLSQMHLPVLQDIDWHVAEILRHQGRLPKEELVIAIVDTIQSGTIKDTRNELFACAHGMYIDTRGDEATAKPLQAKQRRGATATQAYARDLVELFYYIAGLRTGFPTDVLSTNCKDSVETNTTPPEQKSVQQHDSTSNSASVTIGNETIIGDDIQQTIMELVVRCQDYDKIIIDMQCQLNAAVANINTLQEKLQMRDKSTDSINIQDNTDATGATTTSCLSSHSEQLLQGPSVSKSHSEITHETTDTGTTHDSTAGSRESTHSHVEISASLTDLLMCSTPEKGVKQKSQNVNEAVIVGSAEWCKATDNAIDNVLTDIYILKETCTDMKQLMDTRHNSSKTRGEKDSRAIRTLKKSAKRVSAEIQSAKQQLDAHSDIIANIYETGENEVPSIPCSNRFQVLSQTDEDPSQNAYTMVTARRRNPQGHRTSRKKQSHATKKQSASDTGDIQDPHKRTTAPAKIKRCEEQRGHRAPRRKQTRTTKMRVTIVGSSMVRGLGTMVNSDTISACCFTNPGCRTDDMKDRIHQMTRPNDEVIVLACGSNNVPGDEVSTLTAKVDELIEDTRRMRPFAQIIVPEVPRRNDSAELNRKIDASNDNIERICANYDKVHFMRQSFRYSDYSMDKLHLNRSGKEIYAKNLRNKIAQVMNCR